MDTYENLLSVLDRDYDTLRELKHGSRSRIRLINEENGDGK